MSKKHKRVGTVQVLNNIFSKTADAVFASDASSRIVYANAALSSLCNFSVADIMGCPCCEVLQARTLGGESFCSPACPVAKTVKKNRLIEHFDLTIPQPNGSDLWVNVGMLLAPADWRPAKVVFILRPFSIHRILERFSSSREQSGPGNDHDNGLTRRQQQIVRMLAQGSDARDIADSLYISYATARNHINNIYHKLGVHSRAEVISYAYDNGFI